MAAHTITVGPLAEQGFAYEVARRNAHNGTNLTVDQMLTIELINDGQEFWSAWQAATLAMAQRAIAAQVAATQSTTLTGLAISTDPATLAAAAVTAGIV